MRRRSWGLPVLMNPLSATKVKPETEEEEEKNKHVSYIFILGVRERTVFKIMNHQLDFPKEKSRKTEEKFFFFKRDLLVIHENLMFPGVDEF